MTANFYSVVGTKRLFASFVVDEFRRSSLVTSSKIFPLPIAPAPYSAPG
jgi:hypothetical protein